MEVFQVCGGSEADAAGVDAVDGEAGAIIDRPPDATVEALGVVTVDEQPLSSTTASNGSSLVEAWK